MAEKHFDYVIVGGGLAGASAIEAIIERDRSGSILLAGSERHLPYDRPPLSKKLWFGKKKVEDIFIQPKDFYEKNGITLELGIKITGLDKERKTIGDERGNSYSFGKLLLATGGAPRTLSIPGGTLESIYYYRYLDDYLKLRREAVEGSSALVIGGGFIGSEVAAALNINRVDVTMLFHGPYLVDRVFPEPLGRALQARYVEKGVKIITNDRPASIVWKDKRFITKTEKGNLIESDMVVIGAGITPSVELAVSAGLKVSNGIEVDGLLRTSHPDIYAAGDNAEFPYAALGMRMRVEHWDNAVKQGECAGRNMAGESALYDHMPYFFSDLFEFGYEAVGEVSSSLETFADWQKENEKGVVYYLKDNRVRGAMMCDIWDKVEEARRVIREAKSFTPAGLKGLIR